MGRLCQGETISFLETDASNKQSRPNMPLGTKPTSRETTYRETMSEW